MKNFSTTKILRDKRPYHILFQALLKHILGSHHVCFPKNTLREPHQRTDGTNMEDNLKNVCERKRWGVTIKKAIPKHHEAMLGCDQCL
jgi:hypothetical protein